MDISCKDFNSICRLCLSKNDSPSCILQENIVKLLSNLGVDIEIKGCDELPKKICSTCKKNIDSIFTFITQCRTSREILESVLSHKKEIKHDVCEDTLCDSYETEFSSRYQEVEQEILTDKELVEKSTKKNLRKSTLRTNSGNLGSGVQKTNFMCKKCNLIVKSRYCLCTHYKKRPECRPANFKLFKCESCFKEFINLRDKLEHENVHTGQTPYKCPYCIKEFKFKSKLHTHIYRHKLKCGIIERNGIYTEKRVRLKLRCDKCEKIFASRSGFQQHKLKHEGKTLPKKHRDVLDKNIKLYLCNYCARSFYNKANLDAHLRVHTGERPYSCSHCDQRFKQKSVLDRHTLNHLDVRPKPFLCDVCQKSYTTKAHMEIHKRIHTGEKPYECHFCGKSFNYRTHWKIHLRMHTGESPFVCNVCKNSYHDKGSLRKHQKKKNHVSLEDSANMNNNPEKSTGNVLGKRIIKNGDNAG